MGGIVMALGRRQFVFLCNLIAVLSAGCALPAAAQVFPGFREGIARFGEDQKDALKVHEAIYQANGFGNTYLVVTSEGNVVIDTSLPASAVKHRELLRKVSDAPVKFIVITHAHPDHTGGVGFWKEKDTKFVAQRRSENLEQYQQMLGDFFIRRNSAQYGLNPMLIRTYTRARQTRPKPDVLFDESYSFELGGVKFELMHTPGETEDHATVWIPKYRAAFVGDNYYESFPNLYTLRGTKPRWALEYIASIDRVRALKPNILLASHAAPILGEAEVEAKLKRYRDAIAYVHDAVVRGLNDGTDVFQLMRDVKLPEPLAVGEGYGKVSWTVRGMFENYAGWFDENPATMYDLAPTSANGELVRMAGGAEKVAERAVEIARKGDAVHALRLADAALEADPKNRAALEARLLSLEELLKKSVNLNEHGWLRAAIGQTQRRLKEKP
jgi:alkyl sulfatase BDS1-like metallo-beta-lactamase superfamily hydrolase